MRGSGQGRHTLGGMLPVRVGLLRAIDTPPTPFERQRPPAWKPGELQAGYIRWLDTNENMDYGRIAAYLAHLGVKREKVYTVLVLGSFPHVPEIKPPPHPIVEAANEALLRRLAARQATTTGETP